ncbi:MAG: DUF58 domain-containing protein [Anaerolineae bacterium]
MPGRRAALYIILVICLLLSLWLGHPMFFHLTYLALGTLVLSLAWTWSGVIWVRAERHTRTRRGQVGRPLEETIRVRNLSLLPRLWLEVRDHSTLPGHQPGRVLFNIPPRAVHEWQVRTPCMLRGLYLLGPMTLISGDPFGFFEARRDVAAVSEVLVYPEVVPIRDFAPLAGRLLGSEAKRQPAQFITPNAAGVREYAPGDSLNRIHWLSTARRNRLMTKEFEMDPLADVWLVLDNDRRVHPAAIIPAFSTEEHAVKIAASLAQYFLQRARAVGFITYAPDRLCIQPDRGERQLSKILEALAMTRASATTSLHDLLSLEADRFGRATTVVLVTPSTSLRWIHDVRRLDIKGVRVVVVHLDPATFSGFFESAPTVGDAAASGGTAGGFDRAEAVVQSLGAAGVLVYPVRQGDDLSMALSGRPGVGR